MAFKGEIFLGRGSVPGPRLRPDTGTGDGGTPRRPSSGEAVGKEANKPAASQAQEQIAAAERERTVAELETKGFSQDEALRLVDISRRLENSPEARASAEDRKRLEFAQWLVDHGRIGEYNV